MPSHSSCSSLARFDIWIGEKWPTLTVSEPPTGAKALASLAANPMQFSPVLTCSLTQRHGLAITAPGPASRLSDVHAQMGLVIAGLALSRFEGPSQADRIKS